MRWAWPLEEGVDREPFEVVPLFQGSQLYTYRLLVLMIEEPYPKSLTWVLFLVITFSRLRGYKILPNKELHSNFWVDYTLLLVDDTEPPSCSKWS